MPVSDGRLGCRRRLRDAVRTGDAMGNQPSILPVCRGDDHDDLRAGGEARPGGRMRCRTEHRLRRDHNRRRATLRRGHLPSVRSDRIDRGMNDVPLRRRNGAAATSTRLGGRDRVLSRGGRGRRIRISCYGRTHPPRCSGGNDEYRDHCARDGPTEPAGPRRRCTRRCLGRHGGLLHGRPLRGPLRRRLLHGRERESRILPGRLRVGRVSGCRGRTIRSRGVFCVLISHAISTAWQDQAFDRRLFEECKIGSSIRKHAPPSAAALAATVPPRLATSRAAIDNPNPVPTGRTPR